MNRPNKAIVVFDSYPTETILRKGGSFSWDLNADRAKQCDYLICCCSTQGSELRGSAFLIGKISDVVPSPEETASERWMIEFSEYALVKIPDVWKKWQNPVHYFSDEEIKEFEEKLGKSLDQLDFQPVRKAKPEAELELEAESLKTLTINKAKSDLANFFGVDVNAIEIIIRL